MTTRPKGSSINLFNVNGVVSLADIGTVGTDVTVAMLSALNNGYPVFVPAGTWLISNITFPVNSNVFGVGNASILKLKDNANTVAINVGNSNVLRNFTVDGNKANQAASGCHCVDLSVSTRSIVEGVLALNPKGSGFNLAGANADNTMSNCSSTGYTESGFRVSAGTNVSIYNPEVYSSDVAASGDGISLSSLGNPVTNVVITNPKISSVNNRGIACVGNGTKNVSDIVVINPRITSTITHGIHALLVDTLSVHNGTIKSCGGDGVRLEGDTQNCTVVSTTLRSNTGYGMREVINGGTPNYNDLIYNQSVGNGTNAITKVGANSTVV